MDCDAARDFVLEAMLAGRTAGRPESHVDACQDCREAIAGLARAWDALGALPEEEPSPRVARGLRRRVRWAVAREALGSGVSWRRSLLASGAGAIAAVALSLALPYPAALALCERLLSGAMPLAALAAFMGAFYGFLPLLAGAALQAWERTIPRVVAGAEMAAMFLVMHVPYVWMSCREVSGLLLAGLIVGLALGALGGGTLGSWRRSEPLSA